MGPRPAPVSAHLGTGYIQGLRARRRPDRSAALTSSVFIGECFREPEPGLESLNGTSRTEADPGHPHPGNPYLIFSILSNALS